MLYFNIFHFFVDCRVLYDVTIKTLLIQKSVQNPNFSRPCCSGSRPYGKYDGNRFITHIYDKPMTNIRPLLTSHWNAGN